MERCPCKIRTKNLKIIAEFEYLPPPARLISRLEGGESGNNQSIA